MSAVVSDPYLSLPLHGVQVIEASAGTGKTFTLATLVLRLVIERRLRIDQVLAVTFTEAATQELRARIRRRLHLAARLTAGQDHAGGPRDSEHLLTAAIIDAHLANSDEPATALARRLREAADSADLAAVFTIHGFCARVLREHALESGHGFSAPTLLGNDLPLRSEAASDLWRLHAGDDVVAGDLLTLWKAGPDALAADLQPLLRETQLLPRLPTRMPEDPAPRLHAVNAQLAAAWREHGAQFADALILAVQDKVLNGNSYTLKWLPDMLEALGRWSAVEAPEVAFADQRLQRLTAEALAAKTNKGKHARTPQSPLTAVIAEYLQVIAAVEEHQQLRRTALLYRLRDDAGTRINRHKRQRRLQTYDDLIDRVANALDGEQADVLVRHLRAQYKVALVDEFQDTDPRQWRIFDRVFGMASTASTDAPPALFLIGDPKQAIYGFRGGDVYTYLQAARTATAAPPLALNFRSRPGVLAAVAALYAQADADSDLGAFGHQDIRFQPVAAGGSRSEADYLRDGTPAAALTIWRAPPSARTGKNGEPAQYSAPESRALASAACVAEIHRLLDAARAGQAMIDGRPLRPGDIAVLVRSHREATGIRHALAVAGIPAVAAGRQSLFATAEARELHAVLLALLHAGDDGYLRAALATVLIGVDVLSIAALGETADGDGAALRDWQQRAQAWRERMQRGGVLALVNDLAAEHATRLLTLLDGERRLSNYLQLGEMLQEAAMRTLGLPGLIEWLQTAIGSAGAGSDDDAQLLRLESDAQRVQVVTLHKSKGLEYPLVFLPFAGIGGKLAAAGEHVVVSTDAGRVLHWRLQEELSGWNAARQLWQQAEADEAARLLYVGLTRARDALWLASGPFFNHARSPLAPMLKDMDALLQQAPGAIVIDDSVPPATLPWLPATQITQVPPPRTAARVLAADWWVYSFTQLAQADAGAANDAVATDPANAGAAADEPAQDAAGEPFTAPDAALPPAVIGFDPRFAGSRFGNVLHAVLEKADFAAWAQWRDGLSAPASEQRLLTEALRNEGYLHEELEHGIAQLTSLVGRTLLAPLPEGGALHALAVDARCAEIEFHFDMQATAIPALLQLLHAHGVACERHSFGARRSLEGLMTGKIDLTYLNQGRWYVLDYKSNRLDDYRQPALAAAMTASEYDLQALIYTVALHRWLRFRLRDDYDYGRDFGGVRYLFCRGLQPQDDPAVGIFAHKYPLQLVADLDALFAGGAP